MLDSNEVFFPYNIISLLEVAIADIDTAIKVQKRPLVIEDADMSVSVFPLTWVPDETSRQIGNGLAAEPASQNYNVHVQSMVKDWDWWMGLKRQSQLANACRTLIYRNRPLQIALRQLQVSDSLSTETFQDVIILGQEYYANQVNEHVFLSTLRVQFKTEVLSSS